MTKAHEKAMMTDSGATNPRPMSAGQHNHFKTLISSTLDNAVAVGHGHAVGSQGPKGHTMVPSDHAKQGGNYIPQGALGQNTQSTTRMGRDQRTRTLLAATTTAR